jgi:hypothetical protein
MKTMVNYFKRLLHWILESHPIMIVVIPSLLVLVYRESLGKEGIQLLGGIFLVTGTIYGILVFIKLREVFSLPTLSQLVASWLKRFPKWKKDVYEIEGMSIAPSAISSGTASLHMPDDPDLPIDERINRITKNQEAIRKSLKTIHENMSKRNIALTGRIEKLEGSLSSEISQVNSKLESIHMEDFLWALSGLLFILMGTIFSSFAGYIVS